jgi:hypothetical protein
MAWRRALLAAPGVSRAGRYTGGYPVPGCGRHISHRCRGDRKEASPLKRGREMPSLPLRPSLGRPPNLEKPGLSSRIDWPKWPLEAGGHRRTVPECCSTDTSPAPLSNVSRSRPTTGRHACFVMADAECLEGARPPLAPAHFQPPTRLGPAAISTEVPGPVLRAGPDVDANTQALKGHHERD